MNLKHIRETLRVLKRKLPGVKVELLRQERHCMLRVTHGGAETTAALPLSPKSYDTAIKEGVKYILKGLEECKTRKATSQE